MIGEETGEGGNDVMGGSDTGEDNVHGIVNPVRDPEGIDQGNEKTADEEISLLREKTLSLQRENERFLIRQKELEASLKFKEELDESLRVDMDEQDIEMGNMQAELEDFKELEKSLKKKFKNWKIGCVRKSKN